MSKARKPIYVFARQINRTSEEGIIDIANHTLLCLATKKNADIILEALKFKEEREFVPPNYRAECDCNECQSRDENT